MIHARDEAHGVEIGPAQTSSRPILDIRRIIY